MLDCTAGKEVLLSTQYLIDDAPSHLVHVVGSSLLRISFARAAASISIHFHHPLVEGESFNMR